MQRTYRSGKLNQRACKTLLRKSAREYPILQRKLAVTHHAQLGKHTKMQKLLLAGKYNFNAMAMVLGSDSAP